MILLTKFCIFKIQEETMFTRIVISDDDGESCNSDNEGPSEEKSMSSTRTKIVIDDDENNDIDKIKDLEVETEVDSSKSEQYKLKGNQLMEQKNYLAAQVLYTKSLKFDPSSLAARNNRSLAYIEMKVSRIIS